MKMKTFSILAVLLFSSLSGCLSSQSDDEVVTLKILTYDINALSDEVIGQFTNQTGIEVEFIRTDDAGGILDQMMLTKSAPLADLMIGLDNTYLPTAIENGLLMEHSASMDNFTQSSLDFYQGPLAIPFDEGDVCLNYDEDALEAANMTVPTSLWNLTEPEWEGKMAFPSPMTSSPGRAFLTATVDYFMHSPGNESGNMSQWWNEVANNGAIFTSGWTEAYETYYTGGYGEWTEGYLGGAYLTVSYCHSPGVEAFYSGNYTHSTSLVLPHASFHQVEYAGIINGASQVEAANLFLEFLTSPEINVNMPENNLMYSILQGTDLPQTDGYRHHADEAILSDTITQQMIEQSMDGWLALWQAAIQTE